MDSLQEYYSKKKRKKRGLRFYPALILIIIIMIGLIFWGTVLFWNYLEAYELSRHEHTISFLRENIDYDYWEAGVLREIESRLTEFETDAELALEPHLSQIRDVPYTLRQKSDENTAETPVYIVRAGARDIGIVRLVPAGDIGFGFHLWEVGRIEFIRSFVDDFASNISITASQNAEVFVESVLVTEKYRVECDFEYGASYLIQGIFGNVEVGVIEHNGKASEPYYAENGEFYYTIAQPFSRAYYITVPQDAIIFVDGQEVGPDNIAEYGIVPEILIDTVDLDDVPLTFSRYEFELNGLYDEPVVTVEYHGKPLLPEDFDDDGMLYQLPFSAELKGLHEETAEAFIRSFVRFGANVGNNADANYADVSGKMLRGSELLDRTRNAIGTMRWISGTSVQYNSLEIDNFRAYGENIFSCEIRYNITTSTRYETNDVEGDFEVLFVQSGGRWLAADMVHRLPAS